MPALSPREREALQLLAMGLTYQDVACRMGITRRSMRVYLYRARRKLAQPNLVSAVAVAVTMQIIAVAVPAPAASCEN